MDRCTVGLLRTVAQHVAGMTANFDSII